jgi:hypothetical protein
LQERFADHQHRAKRGRRMDPAWSRRSGRRCGFIDCSTSSGNIARREHGGIPPVREIETMSFNRWVLGAAAAGLIMGAGSVQAAPFGVSPMGEDSVQTVQFFFDEPPPPPVYYAPPPPVYYGPPRYYNDYPPPRRDYYPPRGGAYYGPPRGYGPPPSRYAEPRFQQPRPVRPGSVPIMTKKQQRAWNRANGF